MGLEIRNWIVELKIPSTKYHLVDLIYPVCLVCLVRLVRLVHLVCIGCLVRILCLVCYAVMLFNLESDTNIGQCVSI